MEAAKYGSLECPEIDLNVKHTLELLIKLAISCHSHVDDGDGCQHIAAEREFVAILRVLRQQDVDMNQSGHNGHTPFYRTALLNHATTMKLCLQEFGVNHDFRHCKNLENDSKITPSMWACEENDTQLLGRLILASADVNHVNSLDETAAHYFAAFGKYFGQQYGISVIVLWGVLHQYS